MRSIYRHLLSGLILFTAGIALPAQADSTAGDYKQLMREFVQKISRYARSCHPDFIVIPQNGSELLTADGRPGSASSPDYIGAISGIGQEDLFYGYKRENRATSKKENKYLLSFLHTARANNIQVLVTDYCRHHRRVDDSYRKNSEQGFISFAAPNSEVKTIPDYPSPLFGVYLDIIDAFDYFEE
jgi:cysteinyl-tRNA synthetase